MVVVGTQCSENINMYVADVLLEFMLDELWIKNFVLSDEFKLEIMLRLKERRAI